MLPDVILVSAPLASVFKLIPDEFVDKQNK